MREGMHDSANRRLPTIAEVDERERLARDSDTAAPKSQMCHRPNVGVLLRLEADNLRRRASAFDHLARLAEVGGPDDTIEASLYELFMARR